MNCKVCKSETKVAFNTKVLKKYDVTYFKCNSCGLIFPETPYWLDEAYEPAINKSDTGLLDRNIQFSKILSVLIFFNFNKNAKFLDYAGGYGIFTRLMRDIGFDFYWHDLYTKNIFAIGFEYNLDLILDPKSKFELITAFEVFEHLENPLEEISKMLNLTDTIIFSTQIIPIEIPDPNKWWYYGFDHGQHVSFYSRNTIFVIAKQLNLNYYSVNGMHILSKHRMSKSKIIINKLFKVGLFSFVKKQMESRIQSDFKSIKSQ